MDYEAKIHDRWAADTTLNGLIPVARFITGTRFGDDDRAPDYPYATMTHLPGGGKTYTNTNKVAHPQVTLTVYVGADQFDEGKAAIEAVVDAFDRADFALSSPDSVLNMQANGSPEVIQDDGDGTWAFAVGFTLSILEVAA